MDKDKKKMKTGKLVIVLIYFVILIPVIVWAVLVLQTDLYVIFNIRHSTVIFWSLLASTIYNGIFFGIFNFLFKNDYKNKIVVVNKILMAVSSIITAFALVLPVADTIPVSMNSPSGSTSYYIKRGFVWQSSTAVVCFRNNVFHSTDLAYYSSDYDPEKKLYVKWEDDDHFYLKIESFNPHYEEDGSAYYYSFYYISGDESKEITKEEYINYNSPTGITVYDYSIRDSEKRVLNL